MKTELLTEHPQFFTATIHEWNPVLEKRSNKQIITDSLYFLVTNQRIFLYAFVIMNNHIHLIWQMRGDHLQKNVQRDFLKFTAQKIKFNLADNDPASLKNFEVNLKDRKYQFWQRNPLSVPLYSRSVLKQKIHYIHQNPVRASLCQHPENYEFSSAGFYYSGRENFPFLTHYEG